ncbi:diacylglycerol kinase family protein [Embleya sp. NBC_00896]|uniref:diacylglycerol kinase family protein n=1 Tax=Embleya sp. NBC_00896 TaxID=2975961 RepID=UPI003868DBA9|nr:diacylglycerol kinase family protein [Embleya sp. NBC_00896]
MLTEAGRFLRRIVLPLLILTLVLVGLGLLITRTLDGVWPFTVEDDLDRTFAEHRSGDWNALTEFFSTLANTGVIIATTLLAAVVARIVGHSWRGPLFLAGAVTGQALVFWFVQLFVSRDRPDVPRLEQAAATSSFPSGHTGAAFALYGGLAVLLASRLHRRWAAVLVWVLLGAVPLAVAVSRMYRGMHHPSDVVTSLLYAGVVLVVMSRALLSPKSVWGHPSRQRGAPAGADGGRPRAALIVNPIKLDIPESRARIDRILHDAGWAPPLWLETTVADPGAGVTAKALADGVDLVIAAGGDGTIRECAGAMAGTDTPLAVIPAGTGNLLARNLGVPIDLADAVHVALHGRDRRIDLGTVDPDDDSADDPTGTGGGEPRCFTAMAGIGLDAAMVADAPDALKKKVGWPAYVVSGARHLRDRRMRVTLRVDDGEPIKRRARMVLVGNVGALQAGMQLLPGATPDDGLLDVVVFAPYGMTGWAHATVRVIGRRRDQEPAVVPVKQQRLRPIEHFTGRRVVIETDRPEPRELDGDPIGPGTRLAVRIRPDSLTVRVP